MNSNNLLIIFVKNPRLGEVKTRLAKSIGNQKALDIYKALLSHTETVTNTLVCDKAIFYSSLVEKSDMWDEAKYQKFLQEGQNLGEKMNGAFNLAFELDYKNVVIIGSDCLEITSSIIEYAFEVLNRKDVVLGPAHDGGYYLIGMKTLHPELFESKTWSTENVMLDTLIDIKVKGLSYELLDTLSDIDREEDLAGLDLII